MAELWAEQVQTALKHVFVVYLKKIFADLKEAVVAFETFPFLSKILCLIGENMRFVVLEPDGRGNEFVLTGDKLGQDVLDKVKALMISTS